METAPTAIRGKDWVFNALWASCADKTLKCLINIPCTFILRDGAPYRGLYSAVNDDNKESSPPSVKRLSLDADDERSLGDSSTFRGQSNKGFRLIRQYLMDFHKSRGFDDVQNNVEEPLFCHIFYLDGEEEDVSLRILDVLLRNKSWRLQVLMLQGYVPAHSKKSGTFLMKSGSVRSLLESDEAAAADTLAESIAKYAEKAYKFTSSSIMNKQDNDEIKLKVKELQAKFAVDMTGVFFFLNTEFVSVEIKGSGRKEVEDYIKQERRSRESQAAQQVANELHNLLSHAGRRGLPLEESFNHFDPKRCGFVDVDALIDGLARLGIGVTYPVGEAVMGIIGGLGSTFLTDKDFDSFMKSQIDIVIFDKAEERELEEQKNHRLAKKKTSSSSVVHKDVTGKVRTVTIPNHLKPVKLEDATNTQELAADSIKLSDTQNVEWRQSNLDPNQSPRLAHEVERSRIRELPVAESAYNTGKKISNGPELRNNTQKRALHELRKSQETWLKKKSDGGDKTSTIKGGDGEDDNTLDDRSFAASTLSGSTNKSGSKQGKRRGKQPPVLNLQTIRLEHLASHFEKSPDEVLHVDTGVVMTYRVVRGKGDPNINKTEEESDDLRYRSILEVREKNFAEFEAKGAAAENGAAIGQIPGQTNLANNILQQLQGISSSASVDGGIKKVDRWVSFTIIVVPDIFQTLDVLQHALEKILVKFPMARIVFVGYPGMPNTLWPENWVLNSDLHAKCLAKLVQFLKTKRMIGNIIGEPTFLVGVGFGAFILSKFVVQYVPLIPWIESSIKSVIMVNGILKINKSYMRILRDLRTSLLKASKQETNELIISLHLWDQYLFDNGRDECIKQFWLNRRGIAHSDSSKQPYDESNNTGRNFFGVLELLRAILITPEAFDGADILNSRYPIAAIQSTEDIFVDPRNAMHYQVDQLPPERVSINDLSDIFDQDGSVFVAWLKAGHEVLQERTPYLLSVLSSLAQMSGIHPVEAPVDEEKKEDSDASSIEGDEFDVVKMAAKRKKKLQDEREAKEKAERDEEQRLRDIRMKEAEEEFLREQEELEMERLASEAAKLAEDRAREEQEREEKIRLAEEEAIRLKDEAEREKEEHDRRAKKSMDDKDRRFKLAGERRKRELAEARTNELKAFYEREREMAERKQEARDLIKMRKEDSRSKFAADWQKYMDMLEESKRLAKEKSMNLHKLRREEALKRVEEKLAIERSARIAERKRKAEAMIDAILAETIEFEGQAEGGYDIDEDRKEDIKYLLGMGLRLMKDLLHVRQRSVDALKRQMLVEQKYLLFKKQIDSTEFELQRLRRAIRLIEINPSLVGTKEKAEMEIIDMRRSLAHKEESYLELQNLGRQRLSQFEAANKKVQELKVLGRERDALMSQRITNMLGLEAKFQSSIRLLKMDKENAIIEKDKLRIQDALIVRRIEGIKREIKRIKDHKGETVDTDVWVEGVLQRMQTKELRAYLKKELQMEEDLLEECRQKTTLDRDRIVDITEKIGQCRRNADKIGAAGRSLQRQYLKFAAVSVMELMKNLAENHEGAEQAEDVRSRPSNLERLIDFDQEGKSAMEKLRMKDADVRTKDERKMLGMDMIMHPEDYLYLPVVEAEQMSFDEDYQCELSKPDLDRILKLPERIQLALPFLHTDSEVTAHRLFNLFLRNMDDNFFKTRDYLSEGADGGVSQQPDDASTKTGTDTRVSHTGSSINAPKKEVIIDKNDIKNAEIIHDILVREALRDRLRSIGEGEDLSVQERDWLKIDRILAPHVYGLDEPLPSDIHQRKVLVDLSTSVVKLKKMDRATKPKDDNKRRFIDRSKEGDMYNPMRDRYENGEVIFDLSWNCPLNRQQLLDLYRSNAEPKDPDARKSLDLMQKYFVSDDESIMGHNRLQIIWNLTTDISNESKKIDQMMDAEIQATKDAAAAADKSKKGMANKGPESKNSGDLDIKRIWGSVAVVHPACLGTTSQESYFHPSGYNASRDHPASFAVHEERDEPDEDTKVSKSSSKMPKEGPELLGLGVKLIKSHPKAPKEAQFDEYRNDPNSMWFISDSIRELSMVDPRRLRGKTCLLGKKDRLTIFEVKDAVLQSRQSRSHRFKLPDSADARILDITVSITFQGGFSTKGYRLGRLAAALFRLPDQDKNAPDVKPVPIPVGYSPYSMCSPNLPDVLGRLVIFHRPRARPLAPGEFQLVMGSGSCTKYSIEVHCKYASAALPIVDEEIALAKKQQVRLAVCIRELEDLGESLRLAERKLLVCHKMITEAETESQRTLKVVKAIKAKIEQDDEEMTMFEEERRDLQRELSITEIEYAQWATLSSSRVREKEDIKDGIKMMHNFQRERSQEKIKLKEDLEIARRDLPAAIAVIRSYFEAANIAASLNTVVQGPAAAYGASATGDAGGPKVTTPAEDVRRRFKRDGFKNMILEEQQWLMLDQSLNPGKYEWLREEEEQEDQRRIARGKKPKVKKFNAAVEAFRYNKSEIETIIATPFSLLTRQEMCTRKILTKFHDNPEIMKKQYAIAAYGFDPHLAERTRAKNPKAYTKEEKEWESIDRTLHPEVWRYYVNTGDFKNLDLRGANAESTFGKKLGGSDEASTVVSGIDNTQKANLEKMGKLLGMDNASITGEATSIATDKLSLAELAGNIAGKQNKLVDPNQPFKCQYSKDKIFKIWRTPRHKLKDDDEVKTFQLLIKYNGTYASYMEMQEESRKRQANASHAGSHVKWDGHGKLLSTDIDLRGRELLREIDRATHSKNEWMSSGILHGNDQKFPTRVLRMHLEESLDTLLMEQIKERERSDRKSVDTDSDSDEDDAENSDVDMIVEDEADELELAEKLKKRFKRRQKRRMKLKKASEEENVLGAKKKLVALKNKSGQSLVDAILQNQLGPLGCLACRSSPCKWAATCDMEVCTDRKRVLDREIERVKLDKESATIESTVCLSAQLGGNTAFKRLDLLDELNTEAEELDRRMHLNCIDKELHDAYASRAEFVEVKHLHGYTMMLWVNNARQALQARQSRMVAYVVAKEICDDILDWMLDGWFFGERNSTFSVAGKVPTIKKNGMIRSGQDQINAVGPQIAKMKKRQDAEKKGIVLDEAKRGSSKEKSKVVEDEAQMRLKNLKVARDGNAHEHNLNETESTLKFGLFMLTLMYFRAMVFLRREKRSWSGDDDAVGGKKGNKAVVLMSEERMRMLDEENKAASRKKKIDAITARVRVGEQRKKEREAAERREAIFRLQSIIRRQQQETGSICIVQRIFRGHLGRKAARRWALKRAELGAMNALMNAAATFCQRHYRGYRARCLTIRTRMEMAQFISLMRAQEAASDESVYWETHPWQRFKRDFKEWQDKKFKKAHQIQVLGGARLTEEEQERMLGTVIEEADKDYDDNSDEENDVDKIGNAITDEKAAGNRDRANTAASIETDTSDIER